MNPPGKTQVELNNALIEAIHGRNTAVGQRLICEGADVNARSSHQETLLHLAAYYGDKVIADSLLKEGARPLVLDINGSTAAEIATRQGFHDVAILINTYARKQGHAGRVAGELVEGMIITPQQKGHADTIIDERKDKGPPQVGG